MNIQIGQELEFIQPATTIDGKAIAKGTLVRVGHILSEVSEPNVTVVILGQDKPETLMVKRHLLTMHCREIKPAK
jgi:hypothetical protein